MRHTLIPNVGEAARVAFVAGRGGFCFALLVPLVAAGCRQTRPAVIEFLPFGSRADMTTELGEHSGYTLAVDCGDATVGRGNLTLVGDASKPPALAQQLKQLKDEIIAPSVRDIDFAAGVGYGRVCTGGGIVVILSSWTIADRTIARLGLLVDLASSRVNIELHIVPPGSK